MKKVKIGAKKKSAAKQPQSSSKKSPPLSKLWIGGGVLTIFALAAIGAFLPSFFETPNTTLSPAWRKDLDASVSALNEKLEKDPKDADSFISRARVYNQLGRYQNASEDATRAIMVNKNLVDAYTARAWAEGGLQQFDAAVKDCDTALGIKANDVEAYNTKGWAEINLKRYDAARQDLNKAAAINPKYTQVYINMGWADNEQEKYEQAIDDLTKALALEPQNASALSLRAQAYEKSGQSEKAKADRAQIK